MKSNYKRIGDCVKQVNAKNTKGEFDVLLGINIDKFFMPSVANVVGTDLTKYKIVKKNQFACNRMHVGRDYRIPIAMSQSETPFIVSPAYTVFQIKESAGLLPEYLMMWFMRPEFDRECWFHTDADVRGGLPWDLFCDIELPIPHPDKQREIVTEYNTVVNRIKLNEKLNQKLEETAQALYKHWFVDFEFLDENGQAYKSSGGNMVWNDELDKEIPEGWGGGKLDKYVKLSQGQVINAKTRYLVVEKGLPLLKITDLFNDTATMFIDEKKVAKKNIAKKEDLIYTRTGQVGYIFRNKEGVVYNNCFKIIPIQNELSKEFIFWHFKDENVRNLMVELASGSAQSDLAHTAFFSVSVIKPAKRIQYIFDGYSTVIVNQIFIQEESIKRLIKLKYLLLAKMTKVELEKEIG